MRKRTRLGLCGTAACWLLSAGGARADGPDAGAGDGGAARYIVVDRGPHRSILERACFTPRGTAIFARGRLVLDEAARILAEDARIRSLEIRGNTDDREVPPPQRLRLSQQRADAARGYLLKKGVAPERLVARGYGDGSPEASNRTEAERGRNRCIVFKVLEPPEGGGGGGAAPAR